MLQEVAKMIECVFKARGVLKGINSNISLLSFFKHSPNSDHTSYTLIIKMIIYIKTQSYTLKGIYFAEKSA